MTLRALLLRRAESAGDRVVYDDGRRRVGVGELVERASAQAARLAALGVGPRDRVALVLPSGVAYAEALWAIQLLGAVPCTFSPATPAPTLERRIARIRPSLVVTEGMLDGAPPAPLPPDPGVTGEDLAFLQPTSGTSGEPRAAMVRHRQVLAYLRDADPGELGPDDVMVAWVPPWHDLGLVRYVLGAVHHGAVCHLVEPAIRTIPLWLETVSRVRATTTGAPDFAYRLAARMVDPSSVDLSSLRHATIAAEPVRASTVAAFEERFGLEHVLTPGYGLAEATLGLASHPTGEPLVVDAQGHVSCGPALPGVELRIDGPAGEPGQILARGPNVFAGYFDAPGDTDRALQDGWLHTGDLGYLDEHDRVHVLGRIRAMIKRGGGIVAPRELEEAALGVDGVRVAGAVGLPSADGAGERVVLVVEASPDLPAEPLTTAVTRAVTAAVGFAPSEVVVAPPRTVPRSENGKIRHTALQRAVTDGLARA